MRLFRRITQKGQTGQSLVILAIGFLALLGFVGIVTDVSVLFIRYSTMRRAIDAAAIAAAGQMRRVVDTELNADGTGTADGQAMSVANLNLAARQFIEVYGLNPKSVIVETCRAQQVARDANGNALDSGGGRLFDDAGNVISGDTALIERYQELCTEDELKLVRVTAQIDAPTIFLRLFGYPTVTLTESAISQTAVIDVVLIFDVSESMLNETTYDDWDTLSPPQGVRYIPPNPVFYYNPDPAILTDPWDLIPISTQAELNVYTDSDLGTVDARIGDKTLMFEEYPAGSGTLIEFTSAAASPSNREEPRSFCQVRAFPAASGARAAVPLGLRQEYFDYLTNVYPALYPPDTDPDTYDPVYYFDPYAPENPNNFVAKVFAFGNDPAASAFHIGFVPMYNFYGCCNDPDGDWEFDDLICQPFKEARDAAEGFLARLDFLRGDRVGFVTFNRQAHLVDPDGVESEGGGPQSYMIETERDLNDAGGGLLRHGAVETLNRVVGVMAETSHYADENNDGVWDHLVDGYGNITTLRTYDEFLNDVQIGNIIDHPVENSCPFDKAILDPQYLKPEERTDALGNLRTARLLQSLYTIPQWYVNNGIPSGGIAANNQDFLRNYEYKASCAGTNIGGALAGGSLMLWEEGRREGAVWIMVLLSDGAAGASNPIYTIQGESITEARPYEIGPSGAIEPLAGTGGPITGIADQAGYGYFGLCPYGTEAGFGNAATHPTQPQLLLNDSFPTCSDLRPEVRHYCGDVAAVPSSEDGSILDEDDFGAVNRCIDFYDVDDYARDWADWIAVSDLPGAATGGTTGRVADQLLPTVFTIGFGINYGDDTPVVCANDDCTRGLEAGTNDSDPRRRERNADYLGEELLRYIADVGDNFQIDSDYYQLCASVTATGHTTPCLLPGFSNAQSRIGNWIDVTNTSPDWGVRGPCEAAWGGLPAERGNNFSPTTPATSCGNYFAAPSGAELQEVFNQIASRMFTRLSQ